MGYYHLSSVLIRIPKKQLVESLLEKYTEYQSIDKNIKIPKKSHLMKLTSSELVRLTINSKSLEKRGGIKNEKNY